MFGFQNMSYNRYKNIFLYCVYQFPNVFILAMLFTEPANFTYIPLSSFIILLVILLTCASRRKKTDPFSAVEQSAENDIKAEYAIMCFPCLKKKPQLTECEPTTDLSDQFEYIVEKYTIRKVPLLLANTTEDIIERQQEMEMSKEVESQPQLVKDELVNFQVAQEVYNVQRIPPCITVAAHSVCPGRKGVKERPKPSDILESMSPVSRPPVRNQNYVVIPTKGSLRSKDIMMTKREITNQYLNNFSSVFVDNLKDQVPKDPERFPNLSRPYSGALRNYPVAAGQSPRVSERKKSKRYKAQKLAYAFSVDDTDGQEGTSIKEEPYYDSDSAQEQTSYAPDSEFQGEIEPADLTDVFINDSDSGGGKEGVEYVSNPFKTTIKSSSSEVGQTGESSLEASSPPLSSTVYSRREEWSNLRNITYDDIQALDLGYEFTSCEKLGVKPKKTWVHYPHETERLKESQKQFALGDTRLQKMCVSTQEQPSRRVGARSKPLARNPEANPVVAPLLKTSSKSVIAETSFLPRKASRRADSSEELTNKLLTGEGMSATSVTSRSEGSKPQSLDELDLKPTSTIDDSVTEISKLYQLAVPVTQRTAEGEDCDPDVKDLDDVSPRPAPSRSRSFHQGGRPASRNENASEVKGKEPLPYPNPNSTKTISKLDEPETETTYSVCSHESKTSSMVTSVKSSEPDDRKRATLRWKIIIKHHREDYSSRKDVDVNSKQ